MKKITLVLAIASAFAVAGVAQAADTSAQAVATWSATAKKDTSSKLVVTPIGSLTFNYADGVKGFNTQKGLFDVTIEGDSTATNFTLTSKLLTNTLTKLDSSGSTLSVGVAYNGEPLEKTSEITMIDTAQTILGGNLSALAAGYDGSARVSAQDQFTFSINGGTEDGTVPVTDYSTLTDGIWTGDVSVEFNAVWAS